ncbi:hypothetical protein GGX14DRAFT_586968 [Mycena pura]|uniref:Uncharacterized protein n=1 Tax=Mycena pura TaxID=153505 RepID=A0AAD6Y718_9AGAR|nr:hypothetical protein GGX14DRAFT_586968 [Mycena pura]
MSKAREPSTQHSPGGSRTPYLPFSSSGNYNDSPAGSGRARHALPLFRLAETARGRLFQTAPPQHSAPVIRIFPFPACSSPCHQCRLFKEMKDLIIVQVVDVALTYCGRQDIGALPRLGPGQTLPARPTTNGVGSGCERGSVPAEGHPTQEKEAQYARVDRRGGDLSAVHAAHGLAIDFTRSSRASALTPTHSLHAPASSKSLATARYLSLCEVRPPPPGSHCMAPLPRVASRTAANNYKSHPALKSRRDHQRATPSNHLALRIAVIEE